MDQDLAKNKRPNSGDKSDKKIGDYIIKHTIGKGTFGKVKLGQHIPTGENVAIKILEKDKIIDKDDVVRIEREMKICKSLNHLNIIKIFQVNFIY